VLVPLPAELQGYVDLAVGVLAVSKHRDAAQALVKFMSSPEAAPFIRKSGMEPPKCVVGIMRRTDVLQKKEARTITIAVRLYDGASAKVYFVSDLKKHGGVGSMTIQKY
jgi:Bacterial extracellular solute-binding protein